MSIKVDIVLGNSNQKNLIVYFPGILADAKGSAIDFIYDIWLKAGDVMLVEYGKDKFDAQKTTRQVFFELKNKGYLGDPLQTITFIGSSMGGLLSYDVLEKVKLSRTSSEDFRAIDLILMDAPTCSQDFQPPNDKFAPILAKMPFGPIADRVFGFVIPMMFVGPKEENIEPGVDRKVLKARVDEAKSYRLSFWKDEIHYMVNHGVPDDKSLARYVNKVTYVRSTRDHDTVRPEAFKKWEYIFPQAEFKEIDSTHVGFAERPETWKACFRELFNVQ